MRKKGIYRALQHAGESILYGCTAGTIKELANGSDDWAVILIILSIAGYFMANYFKGKK